MFAGVYLEDARITSRLARVATAYAFTTMNRAAGPAMDVVGTMRFASGVMKPTVTTTTHISWPKKKFAGCSRKSSVKIRIATPRSKR